MGKKRKVSTILVITSVGIICFFVGLYVLGLMSEPYKCALEFIGENEVIMENLGPLKSRRLAFFGYSVRQKGAYGDAEYKIFLIGKKGKGTVFVTLKSSTGIWKVVEGNLITQERNVIALGVKGG